MGIGKSIAFERVVVAAALGVAFLIMASVFAPDRSTAHSTWIHHANGGIIRSASAAPGDIRPLGTLESRGYHVSIFATESIPRYTICDAATGRELGVLLTADEAAAYFPDLPLPDMHFDSPEQIMLAEPVELPSW